MKLHLPKALAAAVLACFFADGAFAAATVTNGAITNLGTGATQSTLTSATGAKTTVESVEYVVLNIGSLYDTPGQGQGQYWNGNEIISTNLQIGTSLTESSTSGLWINNGNGSQDVTFSGKIIGAGTIGKASNAPSSGMSYTFTGDLSGFTGSIKAVNSATFGVVYNASNTTTTNLVANNIVASDGTVNMTVSSGATYKFTGGFDVNNLTIGSSSATFSGNTVNATTATINSGAKIVLADGAVLTAGTLTNNGTISFSGNSKLDTGTVFNVGQTYNFGTLENVTKNNLAGLGARADISYDSTTHDITITGATGDLVWGGGDGNLTDANWTWDGAAATFEEGDSLTISGTGSSVTISGEHTVNTLTVKDGAAISLSSAPVTIGTLQLAGEVSISATGEGSSLQTTGTAGTVSGQAITKLTLSGTDLTLANLGTATTFTKAGNGTLTLTGTGMIGNNGTVVVEGGTLAVTSHDSGTAALQQADVTVKAGATLALGYDALGWGNGRTKSITLIGEEGNVATLQHTSSSCTTFQVVLKMQGYATVNGTGSFNSYREAGDTTSGIFVKNNHNTFAAELGIRGPLTINVEGGGSLDFTGKLAKNTQNGGNTTRTVTKAGAGDLNLSNSGNNFDGTFTVSAGTLRLKNGASATSGALTINDGATLAYSGGSVDITGTSDITFQTGSTLSVENGTHLNLKSDNLSLANMTVGNKPTSGLTVSVYNDAALSGNLTLSGSTASIGFINGKTLSIAGGVLTATAATNSSDIQTTVASPVSVTSTEAAAGVKFTNMNVTITPASGSTYNLNSTLSGSGTLTTKGDVLIHESSGAEGVTARLSGFTGDIVVESGSLKLGNGVNESGRSKGLANSLGTGTITVKDNANLSLSAQEITIGNKLVFGNSQLTLRDGEHAHNDGQNDNKTDYTFTGAVTLDGKLTLHNDWDKKETFSGLISGEGSMELTANSSQRAIVEISGSNNTYSGGTNVKGNVQLKATGTNSLGTGTVTLGTTATVSQGTGATIANVLFDNFSDTKNITGLGSNAAMSKVTVAVNENMTVGNLTLTDSSVAIASGKALTAGSSTTDLTLAGSTVIKAGENVEISVMTPAPQAGPGVVASGAGEAPTATLGGVVITDTKASGGSMDGVSLTVKSGKTYELSGMDISDASITLEDAASMKLTNVALSDNSAITKGTGATVSLAGNNASYTLTETSVAGVSSDTHAVAVDFKADASLTGLTIVLSDEFMLGLQGKFYGTDGIDSLTLQLASGSTLADTAMVSVTMDSWPGASVAGHTADSITISFNATVPEPATGVFSLLALAGLAARRRRKA